MINEPNKNENQLSNEIDCYVNAVLSYIPATKCLMDRVREAQKNDFLINKAAMYTIIGWNTYNNDCDESFNISSNLSISNSDILIFRDRLVIPPS